MPCRMAASARPELAVLRNNKEPLNQEEAAGLIDAIIRGQEPDNLHYVTKLLKAGKDPRRILDVMQIAAAQVVMETTGPNNFSMPHHCYEYLQHARLVLRQLRSSAPAAADLSAGVVPEPRRRGIRRGSAMSHPVVDQGAERRGQADRGAVAGARRQRGVRAERAGEPGVDAGVSRQCRRPRRRWCSASRWPRPSWATIRTTRKSPSAC